MNVDDLKSKLADAHKVRDRLLSIVKDLEEDALKNKQKGKKEYDLDFVYTLVTDHCIIYFF